MRSFLSSDGHFFTAVVLLIDGEPFPETGDAFFVIDGRKPSSSSAFVLSANVTCISVAGAGAGTRFARLPARRSINSMKSDSGWPRPIDDLKSKRLVSSSHNATDDVIDKRPVAKKLSLKQRNRFTSGNAIGD